MKSRKKEVQKRAARRLAISLPVTYHTILPPIKNKLKIRAQTKDISSRGLGFIVSHKPTSSVMNVQLQLPEKSKGGKPAKPKFIKAKMKIIYTRPVSKSHQDILRTGACFVKMNKRDTALLRKLLAEYK